MSINAHIIFAAWRNRLICDRATIHRNTDAIYTIAWFMYGYGLATRELCLQDVADGFLNRVLPCRGTDH